MNELILSVLALSITSGLTSDQWHSVGEITCLKMVEELAIVEAKAQHYYVTPSFLGNLRGYAKQSCHTRTEGIENPLSYLAYTEVMADSLPTFARSLIASALETNTHKL